MTEEEFFAKKNERIKKISSNIGSTELAHRQKIEKKDNEITELKSEISQLKEQVSDLTSDTNNLRIINNNQESNINDLVRDKNSLFSEIDNRDDKINDLEHQNNDLKSQISDLNAENGKLSNSMGEYKEKLNTSQLRKKEDDLEFNQLLKDYKELKDSVYWKTEDIKKYRIALVVLIIIINILLFI
jgi:chromosome segregation ATPase